MLSGAAWGSASSSRSASEGAVAFCSSSERTAAQEGKRLERVLRLAAAEAPVGDDHREVGELPVGRGILLGVERGTEERLESVAGDRQRIGVPRGVQRQERLRGGAAPVGGTV